MNPGSLLFNNGDLAATLDHHLGEIANAVAGWNEDRLLSLPESDVYTSLEEKFLMQPVVLDLDGIATESVEDGFTTARQFDEEVRIRQTSVTIAVPFSGDRQLLTLTPSTRTYSPPRATVGDGELKVYWVGPRDADAAQVQQGLNNQLETIQKWLGWSAAQVNAYNQSAKQRIVDEVRARKGRVLSNRNLQASLGFPMRKRPDAATYSVPITRRKIIPSRPVAASEPFRPEPALDDAQYEAALAALRNQRNALERAPSTSAKMGEEEIRNLLLVNLNGQFEGRAAGEVFNNTGKTDILIREGDRHIFIGECKIWKGPKTITDTLDQLLSYLTWRDTKAALLLFIRSGNPSEVIAKALPKFEEHTNYKRAGQHATDERHDFVFHANSDPTREIKLAFLPFYLPKDPATS